MTTEAKTELPAIPFGSQNEFEQWLDENYAVSKGIWLQFYKKGSGTPSIIYAEALDAALCFGWIDGQLKRGDENYYLQKFTPRRAHSTWSKRNIGLVAHLEKEGKIRTPGWKAIEAAKADGRWDNAYDSPGNFTVPEDLLSELAKDEKSLAFFESLNRTNKYAIAWRLQSAKRADIREKRMKVILEMIARGEKIHP